MSAPAKKCSTEAKKKDLMLDKDMEKDTWNFKSMTDDDPMDFNFELPVNKKKNAFKLDMGFDLDGDFGNLSSFKMDMPDFDFSSPVKKTTKTKESPDDKSSGDLKQKKSPFAFSYDFDGLDDFDLDSSPPKKGSKTTTKAVDSKAMDCEEISARSKIDKSDSLDFGPDLPITRQAAYMTNTDVKAKSSAEKENLISKTTDTMVVDSSAHSKQATEESMENSEAVESPQGIRIKASPTHTMCLQPQSVNTSPPKTSCAMVEDIDDPCLSNETATPSPLHASETAHTAANKETSPDIHEICRSSTKENRPRDSEQNANNEMISTMDSRYEKTEQTKPNISSRLCLDKIDPQQEEMGTGTQAEMQDHTRTTASDPDAERSQITLSGKISPGPRLRQTDRVQNSCAKLPLDPSHRLENPKLQTDQVEESSGKLPLDPSHRLENPKLQTDQVQDSSGKLPLDPSHRLERPKMQTAQVQDSSGKLPLDPSHRLERPKMQTVQVQDSSAKLPLDPSHSVPGINDLKTMQNKDSGLIRSKFFKKAEKPQSDVLESSLIQTESRPVTRERIALNMNLTNDRRYDIKDALPGSKTRPCPTELVKTDSETANVNTISSHEKIIHKDQPNANTAENVAGQLDHLKLQAKNTTREKSILQINISSKLDASSLTQKLSKNLNSGAESLQKSKLVSLERPKLANMVFDLRSTKTQRTTGVNKDQPSSAVQPEVNSSMIKERETEAPVKKGSETHHLDPRDKTQLLHCPSSLKRKALDEDADRSLKPQLKRFLMSPRENRKAEELTHRVAQGKFASQERVTDNNTSKELVKESSQTTSHHQIMNMANLEIPVTENADNIEKAEAYTKELESICNILKKKHEEAKELLVRAVVNNNKLLMLNHPLHEDKIRMIQRFVAKLTLRDTQTTVA